MISWSSNFYTSTEPKLIEYTTLQQQIALCVLENFWENLCLRNRILSLQQVAKNQIKVLLV